MAKRICIIHKAESNEKELEQAEGRKKMTDIEILEAARYAVMEEVAISRQLERLAIIGGPKGVAGQALTGMPHGTNDPEASRRQQYEGLMEKLLKKRNENINIVCQCESVIEKIKDQRSRTIARYYYVEGESDYTIAKIMGLDRSTIWDRRNEIINFFSRQLKNTENNKRKRVK